MIVILAACALILALVDEASSHGRDLVGWAVAILATAVLWGRLA